MQLVKATKNLIKKSSALTTTIYNVRRMSEKPLNLLSTLEVARNPDALLVQWWTGVPNNWGDALNPVLVERLSGRKPYLSRKIINVTNKPVYSVIGSVLGQKQNRIKNIVVWGSGFMSEQSSFEVKPRGICAVRGPLTRNRILSLGLDCPEVYGDPALLYPLFYKPKRVKKYKLGIIPHHQDRNDEKLKRFEQYSDVLIIDILGGIDEFIDEICSCELIASTSLHGIIAADSYDVPSAWIELSDKVSGGGFKFFDYFQSVGRECRNPLQITENTSLQQIYDQFEDYKIDIDLAKLLDACPFKAKETASYFV